MDLLVFVETEIQECVDRLRRLDFQLQVDTTYVGSPEADPNDLQFFRCQVDLGTLEKQYLEQRLVLLRQMASDPKLRRVGKSRA